MRLTMKQRQAVTAVTAQRYRQGSKKVKQQLLDEFCEITGYCRGYARYVRRNHGRQIWLGGKRTIVGDACKRQQRLKPKVYDEPVLAELRKLWELLNYVCGKRLVAIMPELIAKLEQFGELRLPASTKEKLLRISAATVERLLPPERRKQQLRRRSQTKPGTLLKHQIPIRTFAEWDEQRPGFAEIDLVAHDGGLALGDYCQTLDLTDVCSGWTETEAVPNKAQVWVFQAIQTIRARLPFPLLGLDSDNGSEFVNEEFTTLLSARAAHLHAGSSLSQERQLLCRTKELFSGAANSGLSTLRHDGRVNGAEAVVPDVTLIHQFLSANDEAEKQRTFWQSREEELPRAADSLSTRAGL